MAEPNTGPEAASDRPAEDAAARSPSRERGVAGAPDEQAERAAEVLLGANPTIGFDKDEIIDATKRVLRLAAVDPRMVLREEIALIQELGRITIGRSSIKADPKDRRFRHEIWTMNPVYKRVMQSYLAWRKSLFNILDRTDASDPDKERARFALALATEAVAPTNTLLGNPGALFNIYKTRGRSLLKGFGNMVEDILNNGGMPASVDQSKFQVGKNVATTPGNVVYRDEVFELIQYRPSTKEVFAKPLLVVPPQINKFYILDIAKGRSFAEFITQHGVQLFVISWRNPTAAQRDWNLETYLKACKKAMEVVCQITGSEDLNLAAACAGGYTSATLLGHLAAREDRRVNSATFLVTVLDAQAPSLMGMFASKNGIKAAMMRSKRKGVLEGRDMARVFAWLRPNDLVWSFFANNWVMGNDPPAFDVLYWNNDSTRLPAAFHADMLQLYLKNPLVRPDYLEVLGTPIDMHKVNCDSYVVAGITDHITPWKACYETRRVLSGSDTTFVLSSSGHIQSLVNPPDNPKAKYYTNPDLELDADEWLRTAELSQGSWWEHWYGWISERSGERKAAPESLGSEEHPPRDKAPGRYVHQR